MKKSIKISILICIFAVICFVSESIAEPNKLVRMGINLDYNLINMAQINKQLNKGNNVTALDSGISGMLDLDLVLAPALMLGVRAGYLYCLPGSASYNVVPLLNKKTTVNASLIPVEAGLSLNFELPEMPISLMAGVFGGYGFASVLFNNNYIPSVGSTVSVSEPYNGQGYIGELVAVLNLKVVSSLSLNINGGYRMAKITKLVRSEDVNNNGIPYVTIPAGKKGDVLKDSDNNDMAFDFSGFNIGVGMSAGF